MNEKISVNELEEALKYLNSGDDSSARSIYQQISTLPEDDIRELALLADLATGLGDEIAVINILNILVEKQPDNTIYQINLSLAYLRIGLLTQAEVVLNTLLDKNPNNSKAYVNLAFISMSRNNHVMACDLLEKAYELKPSDSSVLVNYATALANAGRVDEALKIAKKLVKLHPKDAQHYHLLGTVLIRLGDFQLAMNNFEKAISMDSTLGHAYSELVAAKKFTVEDRGLIAKIEKNLNKSIPAKDRVSMHFALGKIYNDLEEWDMAFEQYRQGNLLGKPSNYERHDQIIVDRTYRYYTKEFFEKYADIGSNCEQPVFVVGMPRSGTTLLEQIISSHPKAGGAGELTYIERVHSLMCPLDKLKEYKKQLEDVLSSEALARLANTYLDALTSGREDCERIVDKLPDNYIMLGFIRLIFPNAKIIHITRSPLDVCLSCYFQFFKEARWSYDFGYIADRYHTYRAAMKYWNKVLPETSIMEVAYEDIISDTEKYSREVIEFLGLEWDDACLDFHNKKSAVSTASLWQVRQPIYKTSTKRWQKYAKHIEPLANELYEYLDREDIDAFEKLGIKLKKPGFFKRLIG